MGSHLGRGKKSDSESGDESGDESEDGSDQSLDSEEVELGLGGIHRGRRCICKGVLGVCCCCCLMPLLVVAYNCKGHADLDFCLYGAQVRAALNTPCDGIDTKGFATDILRIEDVEMAGTDDKLRQHDKLQMPLQGGFLQQGWQVHSEYGDICGDAGSVIGEHRTFPGHHGAVSAALSFSGGGARSLTLSMGYLRALEDLGLMSRVDAIAAVSGGAWAAAVYMFANMGKVQLLGAATVPAWLTMDVLQKEPPALGATVTKRLEPIARRLVGHGAKGNKIWIDSVAELILKPFGLDSKEAFMAADAIEVARIRLGNPDLADYEFLTPQPGRPKTFVMGGAVLAPTGYKATNDNMVYLQMSPDFTGSPFYPDNSSVTYDHENPILELIGYSKPNVYVGGGLIESFAFGGLAPMPEVGGSSVRVPAPELPFSLAEAVGISSCAPASQLASTSGLGLLANRIDPQGYEWPIQMPGMKHQSTLRYNIGDGGNMENNGLLAMIQRGAKKVVWFMNTNFPLIDLAEFNFCEVSLGAGIEFSGKVSNQVYDKFGFGEQSTASGEFVGRNQVFAKDELAPLLCKFQKMKADGKAIVVRSQHLVLPNTWWGITGGYSLDIIAVYNEVCQDFMDALPSATRQEVHKGRKGAFANYPHYATLYNNRRRRGQGVSLTGPQVNLLSAQAEFAVHQNADLFRDFLMATR
eukprot:CAMPEP_0180441336 /NCGR_PEP_ID=MMETSP1036_2-20121128/13572_1 /TAXON_ID=632150 /ORGANISM="Azadinium spinosum, Strain 3D9" /LENGTH=693 /DNA_ID=CAMNT_0022447545 /DNA_START=134 /DNA_END=2218 /DNA_ORIENTATION=-